MRTFDIVSRDGMRGQGCEFDDRTCVIRWAAQRDTPAVTMIYESIDRIRATRGTIAWLENSLCPGH